MSNTLFNPENFSLTVDYSKTLKQMIAAGKYDAVSKYIIEKWSLPTELIGQKIDVNARIFFMDFQARSEQVIDIMKTVGYRPANLGEILSFGALNVKIAKKYTIAALNTLRPLGYNGSVVCISFNISKVTVDINDNPCSNVNKLNLNIQDFGASLWNSCHFLAVSNN